MLYNAEPKIDPRKVALYIRWSTEEQGQGTTLEVQRDGCEGLFKSQQWGRINEELVFVDDGWSGGSLNRPAISNLRAAVQAGKVEAVVVYKLDRLSRNLLDCVTLVRQEWAGISLFSANERFDTHSAIGQMVFNILVSFAEFERNVIRERTMSGKMKRMEQGRNSGFAYPYGYMRSADGGFAIDPGPADIVRRIFEEYLSGSGVAAIAHRLNQDGLPAPDGGLWRDCTLSAMIENPFYAGQYVAGAWKKDSQGRYRKGAPAVTRSDTVPPIIPQAEFDRAQAVRAERAKGPRQVANSEFLLSGLLKCHKCGASMSGNNSNTRRYYQCLNLKHNRSCRCGLIPADDIEAKVLDSVRRYLSDENLEAYIARIETARQSEIDQRSAAVTEIDQRMRGLTQHRNKLDADYFAGTLPAATYGRLSGQLDASLAELSEQHQAASAALAAAQAAVPDTARLKALAAQIATLNELTLEELRHFLRQVTDSLTADRDQAPGKSLPVSVYWQPSVRFLTTQ